MKRGIVLCLVAALTVSIVPATTHAHNAPNRCGQKKGLGAGWFKLRGHNVRCKKARLVARRWERKCITNQNCPRRRARINVKPGYRCRRRNVPDLEFGLRVRCTAKGRKVVHFLWGA